MITYIAMAVLLVLGAIVAVIWAILWLLDTADAREVKERWKDGHRTTGTVGSKKD